MLGITRCIAENPMRSSKFAETFWILSLRFVFFLGCFSYSFSHSALPIFFLPFFSFLSLFSLLLFLPLFFEERKYFRRKKGRGELCKKGKKNTETAPTPAVSSLFGTDCFPFLLRLLSQD